MSRGIDDPAVFLDLVLAFRVAEVLAADGTGPVFVVAGFSAGSIFCLGLDKLVFMRLVNVQYNIRKFCQNTGSGRTSSHA